MLLKSKLRERLLGEREALSAGEVEVRSQKIFKTFQKHLSEILTADYQNVGLYYPIRGEVDSRFFFKFFKARKKACLFPKVSGKTMAFYEVGDWSELQVGSLGIGEPRPKASQKPVLPDVVLVPGVGFSTAAFRLGFGVGFYDRAIDEWERQAVREKLRLVGLAYDFQIVPELPIEPHDCPIDFVVTEQEIFKKGSVT